MAPSAFGRLRGALDDWRAARMIRTRAAAYVAVLWRDPAPEEAQWLASHSAGDLDHARWELRYARRALGLLTAQRDALDDRTASVVAPVPTAYRGYLMAGWLIPARRVEILISG